MEETINDTETGEFDEAPATSDTVRLLAMSAATTVAIIAGPIAVRKVKDRIAARRARAAAETLANHLPTDE